MYEEHGDVEGVVADEKLEECEGERERRRATGAGGGDGSDGDGRRRRAGGDEGDEDGRQAWANMSQFVSATLSDSATPHDPRGSAFAIEPTLHPSPAPAPFARKGPHHSTCGGDRQRGWPLWSHPLQPVLHLALGRSTRSTSPHPVSQLLASKQLLCSNPPVHFGFHFDIAVTLQAALCLTATTSPGPPAGRADRRTAREAQLQRVTTCFRRRVRRQTPCNHAMGVGPCPLCRARSVSASEPPRLPRAAPRPPLQVPDFQTASSSRVDSESRLSPEPDELEFTPTIEAFRTFVVHARQRRRCPSLLAAGPIVSYSRTTTIALSSSHTKRRGAFSLRRPSILEVSSLIQQGTRTLGGGRTIDSLKFLVLRPSSQAGLLALVLSHRTIALHNFRGSAILCITEDEGSCFEQKGTTHKRELSPNKDDSTLSHRPNDGLTTSPGSCTAGGPLRHREHHCLSSPRFAAIEGTSNASITWNWQISSVCHFPLRTSSQSLTHHEFVDHPQAYMPPAPP